MTTLIYISMILTCIVAAIFAGLGLAACIAILGNRRLK